MHMYLACENLSTMLLVTFNYMHIITQTLQWLNPLNSQPLLRIFFSSTWKAEQERRKQMREPYTLQMSTLSRTVPRQGQEPGTSAGAPCGQRFAHSVASQIRYQEARLEARSSLDLSHILWYRMPASQSGSPTYCAIAHLKFIKNVRGGVVMFFPFPIYQSIYLSQSCLFGKQETELPSAGLLPRCPS